MEPEISAVYSVLVLYYTHVVGGCTQDTLQQNLNFERLFFVCKTLLMPIVKSRVNLNSCRISLKVIHLSWMWIKCESLTEVLPCAETQTLKGAQTRQRFDWNEFRPFFIFLLYWADSEDVFGHFPATVICLSSIVVCLDWSVYAVHFTCQIPKVGIFCRFSVDEAEFLKVALYSQAVAPVQ